MPKHTIFQTDDIGNYVNSVQNQSLMNILDKIWKPQRSYKFPNIVQNGQNRKFNYDWLVEFPWLAYSKKFSGAFCSECVLFSRVDGHNVPLGQLVTKPFCNYKV